VPAKDEVCVVCGFDGTLVPYVRLSGALLGSCGRCGSMLYLPRPDPASQLNYHDSSDYFEHPYLQLRRNRDAQIRLDRRCASVFARLSSATGRTSFAGATHLDIGCDTGAFLRSAERQFGTTPRGIDVAKRAVAEAVSAGTEAYACTLEDAPPHVTGADIITAIDVIEHVTDPRGFLGAVAKRLAPTGACYLETPNIRSCVYGLGRLVCNWTGYAPALIARLFPPEHIQYFSTRGLAGLARASGLDIAAMGTRILPAAEIAVSPPVRATLVTLQSIDRLLGREILLWVVLRRQSGS
jgi:SAM-dependent methyltransferase